MAGTESEWRRRAALVGLAETCTKSTMKIKTAMEMKVR